MAVENWCAEHHCDESLCGPFHEPADSVQDLIGGRAAAHLSSRRAEPVTPLWRRVLRAVVAALGALIAVVALAIVLGVLVWMAVHVWMAV